MLIRAKFSKLKPVRYISHLELMNTFRKAFRRAKLPVVYSKGYNPHINFSMGQPLPVGMIGKAEYFDLQLKQSLDRIIFLNRINEVLPSGIEVLDAGYVPKEVKSLQAVINTAVYLFDMEFNQEIEEKKVIKDLLNQDKLVITRYRRNKENRKIDLRPMIYDITLKSYGTWEFTVSTGSRGNVRPTELSRLLADRYLAIEQIPLTNIVRKKMLVRTENKLDSPLEKFVAGR